MQEWDSRLLYGRVYSLASGTSNRGGLTVVTGSTDVRERNSGTQAVVAEDELEVPVLHGNPSVLGRGKAGDCLACGLLNDL